jgi:hypothetical protein
MWEKRFGWKWLKEAITLPGGLVTRFEIEDPSRCVTDYAKLEPDEDICDSMVAAMRRPEILDKERLETLRQAFPGAFSDIPAEIACTSARRTGKDITLPRCDSPFLYAISARKIKVTGDVKPEAAPEESKAQSEGKSTSLDEKVLWHILEESVVSESQRNSFTQKVNNASMRSDASERIWILRRGESIEKAMAKIRGICPNAVFDVALSSTKHIDRVPPASEGEDEIKMLVFKGKVGDFTQVEGVITALRALHLERDRVIPALMQIYAVMKGSGYDGKVPSAELLASPRDFARNFIFDLPPADALPVDDISKLNEQLLKLLTAA